MSSSQAQIRSTFLLNLKLNFINFWKLAIPFLLIFLILRLVEVFAVFRIHTLEYSKTQITLMGWIYDLEWVFYILGFLLIMNLILSLFDPHIGRVFVKIILAFLIVLQGGLLFYFTKMLLPLGTDLYAYSLNDIFLTLKASGELNLFNILAIIAILAVAYLLLGLGKWIPISLNPAIYLTVLCYGYLLGIGIINSAQKERRNELESNLTANKSSYFYGQSYNYFTSNEYLYFDFFLASTNSGDVLVTKSLNETNYPFLHSNNYPDVLGPFFDNFEEKPDIVFVIVEGLGKAYSGEDAYLESFTPFLDSLSDYSLYWKNGLSTTGRTFGVLTGMFGSLPFAQKGFMDQSPTLPLHHTLLSLLKRNGYQTNFHIGADKNFDNVNFFLQYQQVDRILDMTSFDADFEETPSKSGFSWGYPDKAMFQNGMRKLPVVLKPQINIFQTQTSHDPFLIPDEEKYLAMFEDYITNDLKITTLKLPEYRMYKNMYASILYVDEAIKEFFEAYQKLPKYENTIFVITGDHRLPEIPLATTIDRFHVPIMIFSPKLNQGKRMHGVTTHFEITPTILSLLENRFDLDLPSLVAWKGYVMDTSSTFQSKISNPLMRNKNQLVDFLSGEYVLADNQLYQLYDNMGLEPITNVALKEKLQTEFETYKNANRYATENNRILPDSMAVYIPKN
ncbi:LTA synthase family protein [Aquiflexum sp. TKW24L]|uniref:LTA synthase family protein n=1 Tax=Aquiflexum sp. TKW24L TaxID=2942212 RepID=UPI0020C13533|nr:LTA synthase family protein [Aquiflexum sp. TKW24L]MCL6259644.1 LTA synthase family protein [Aquiflexum sp. TKW24L]